MPQRTLITEVNDIKAVARGINIFSCRKQIFKVQLYQFNAAQNQGLEKTVVRYYSLGQHSFWNALPGYTLIIYLFMLLTNIIPYDELGVIATILLYAPFAFGSVFLLRILIAWYAKRSLMRLATTLETERHKYSYVFHSR